MTLTISYDLVVSWDAELAALTERIAGPLFTRPEPRATFADLVRGLMAEVPRKNSWQLADHVGYKNAYRFEWLLNGAKWDADALRAEVRDYVIEHLGSPDGVLVADDTQAIKKGGKSVGVAPQHCGANGQIENCQVLPMLTYASAKGHAFINRRLYLPACWTDDPGQDEDGRSARVRRLHHQTPPSDRDGDRGTRRRHPVSVFHRRFRLWPRSRPSRLLPPAWIAVCDGGAGRFAPERRARPGNPAGQGVQGVGGGLPGTPFVRRRRQGQTLV
ncbi:hypothetical protein Acor_75360 [Acrocarpospora corrugata]|uniref:Transposase IS701-like DDE domain-containing protein n=1 Tax=Acrocarpospora corrugata TaxID=35763 RepID=A0A5M3WGE7_9ACTN|nr:hypothetical protein Acor_75360 [Acrocarpospora corrugata]